MKKIALMLIFFLLLISGCSNSGVSLPNATPIPTFNEIPTKYPFTVAIDAGHGGFDGGATGVSTGTPESELNLDVAKKLKTELIKKGFNVVMTRETEDAIGVDKNSDMRKRKEILGGKNIDIIVSIHMNKFSDRSVFGPMVFYMKGSLPGEAFAKCMIYEICEAVGHSQRASNPGDYYVIRETSAPAIIVECGFLSNKSDEKKLLTEEYRAILAHGIANGIMQFYDGSLKNEQ
ncbi:MAG: N-acetylmuramoyl-L-alanine amidase [Clostridia bacterium]